MIGRGMIAVLFAAISATQASAQPDTATFTVFEHRPAAGPADARPAFSPPRSQKFAGPRERAEAMTFRETIYAQKVREAELRHRLPPGLLRALIWTESRFNPMAISPAGAAGLAQLMPGTALYLGVANRHDPASSIEGGARYLRELLDMFGQIDLALAAYNAGPGAVLRIGGIPRNGETPGYVRRVLERWQTLSLRS